VLEARLGCNNCKTNAVSEIFELDRKSDGCEGRIGILDGFGPAISHFIMSRGISSHHPRYIHLTDPRQMLYRLIVGLKSARGLRIPASIHIKLALDISLALTSGNFYTLLSSTPRPMVYFDDDSEQYTSWKKVGNLATYLAVSRRLRNMWTCPSFKILNRRTALRQRHWPLPLSMKSDLSSIYI